MKRKSVIACLAITAVVSLAASSCSVLFSPSTEDQNSAEGNSAPPEFVTNNLIDFGKDTSVFLELSDDYTNGGVFGVEWTKNNVSFDTENKTMELSVTKSEDTYYGGEARTTGTLGALQYGYFGCEMKPSNVAGTASTFFTYRGDPHDEIDIEFLGKDTTKVQFNYFANGIGQHEYMYDLGFDASEEYHQYGFYWSEDRIVWYVDYIPVYEVTGDMPSNPQQLYTNIWVGDPEHDNGVMSWMGTVSDDDLPATAIYRSISISSASTENVVQSNGKTPDDDVPAFVTKELIGFDEDTSMILAASDEYVNGDTFGSSCGKGNVSIDAENKTLELSVTKSGTTYYGGEMGTIGDVGAVQYGYFGCEMKPSNVAGTASTFFTYASASGDEIDIEFLGNDTTKVHFDYSVNGVGGHEYTYDLGFDASKEYHQYGFYWDEDMIVWYVDNEPVYEVVGTMPSHPQRIYTSIWVGNSEDEDVVSQMGTLSDRDLPATASYRSLSVAYLNGSGLHAPVPEYVPDISEFTTTSVSFDQGSSVYTKNNNTITYENLTLKANSEGVMKPSYSNVYGLANDDIKAAGYIALRLKNNGTEDYVKVRVDVQSEDGTKINEKAWQDGEKITTDLTYGGSFFILQPGQESVCIVKYSGSVSKILLMLDSTRDDKESFSGSVTISEVLYAGTNDYVEQNVSLDQSYLLLKPGETAQLNAVSTGDVVWSVENPNIATVVNGLITAVGEGTTTVKATTGSAVATCTVKVSSQPPKAEETGEIVAEENDLAKTSYLKSGSNVTEETENTYNDSTEAVAWKNAPAYDCIIFGSSTKYIITANGYIEYYFKNIGHTTSKNGETINGVLIALYSGTGTKVNEDVSFYKTNNADCATDVGNGWTKWTIPLSRFNVAEGTEFDGIRFKLYAAMDSGEAIYIDGLHFVTEESANNSGDNSGNSGTDVTDPDVPNIAEFTTSSITFNKGNTDFYTVTDNTITYTNITPKSYKNIYGDVAEEVKTAQYIALKLKNNGTEDYVYVRVDVRSENGTKINAKAWQDGEAVYTDLINGGSFFTLQAGQESLCIIKIDGTVSNVLLMLDSCTRKDKDSYAGSVTVEEFLYLGNSDNSGDNTETPDTETSGKGELQNSIMASNSHMTFNTDKTQATSSDGNVYWSFFIGKSGATFDGTGKYIELDFTMTDYSWAQITYHGNGTMIDLSKNGDWTSGVKLIADGNNYKLLVAVDAYGAATGVNIKDIYWTVRIGKNTAPTTGNTVMENIALYIYTPEYTMGTPENVTYDEGTHTVSWDAVENATYYQVSTDGTTWTKVKTTSYVISAEGSYTFYVRAGAEEIMYGTAAEVAVKYIVAETETPGNTDDGDEVISGKGELQNSIMVGSSHMTFNTDKTQATSSDATKYWKFTIGASGSTLDLTGKYMQLNFTTSNFSYLQIYYHSGSSMIQPTKNGDWTNGVKLIADGDNYTLLVAVDAYGEATGQDMTALYWLIQMGATTAPAKGDTVMENIELYFYTPEYTMETPATVTYDEGTHTGSWTAVDNAAYYQVCTDGNNWTKVKATSYTLTRSGDYTVYVRACSANDEIVYSVVNSIDISYTAEAVTIEKGDFVTAPFTTTNMTYCSSEGNETDGYTLTTTNSKTYSRIKITGSAAGKIIEFTFKPVEGVTAIQLTARNDSALKISLQKTYYDANGILVTYDEESGEYTVKIDVDAFCLARELTVNNVTYFSLQLDGSVKNSEIATFTGMYIYDKEQSA